MSARGAGVGALAGLLATVGVLAALIAALLVSPGRNLTDADEFADAIVAALQSSEGEEAVTRIVADRTGASGQVPADVVEPAAAAGVEAAFSQPTVLNGVRASARQVHRQVVARDASDRVSIDLDALREPIVQEVSDISPQAGAAVPSDLGSVEIASGEAVAAAGRAAWWAGRPGVMAGLLAVAIAGIALSILLAGDRGRLARGVGIALLVGAAIPIVISLIAGPLTERVAAVGGTGDLAAVFVSEIASLRTLAPLGLAVAGGVLIAMSLAFRRL